MALKTRMYFNYICPYCFQAAKPLQEALARVVDKEPARRTS